MKNVEAAETQLYKCWPHLCVDSSWLPSTVDWRTLMPIVLQKVQTEWENQQHFSTFYYVCGLIIEQLLLMVLFCLSRHAILHVISHFLLFSWFCCQSNEKRDYRTTSSKAKYKTKGQWTAGHPSPHQPRCQLIAADILPMLFQSKYSVALLCFVSAQKGDIVKKCHPLWASRYSTKLSNYCTVFFQSTQQFPEYSKFF